MPGCHRRRYRLYQRAHGFSNTDWCRLTAGTVVVRYRFFTVAVSCRCADRGRGRRRDGYGSGGNVVVGGTAVAAATMMGRRQYRGPPGEFRRRRDERGRKRESTRTARRHPSRWGDGGTRHSSWQRYHRRPSTFSGGGHSPNRASTAPYRPHATGAGAAANRLDAAPPGHRSIFPPTRGALFPTPSDHRTPAWPPPHRHRAS